MPDREIPSNLPDQVELVRKRFHGLSNDMHAIKLSIEVVMQRLTSIVERSVDHENRIREIERLGPKNLAATLDRLDAEVDRLKIRMAGWAGGGAVLGAVLATIGDRIIGG